MKTLNRIVIIAPTRSTCLNISIALSNDTIPPTLLMKEKKKEIFEAVDALAELGGFGVVSGTGTGKTVAIRDIVKRVLGEDLRVDIVTREHEATDYTWTCNTLVVTPGVALHWLKMGIIGGDDLIVIDEIHQTSDHLELSMALAKRPECLFIWMSATIDPREYQKYLKAVTVIHCAAFDPSKKAEVEVVGDNIEHFLASHIEKFMEERRGVAVFVPTRAQTEVLSKKFSSPDLYCDFYHGGESAEKKLRKFLVDEVERPFIIFMTTAGNSGLNVLGLDRLVVVDEMFDDVIHSGVRVLEKLPLDNNKLIQTIGRINGRVIGGKAYILSGRKIDFHFLKPEIPKFHLGGDPQHLALVCAQLQVDVSELKLIAAIDRGSYEMHIKRFRDRGIIATDEFGLTPYGEKVERLPVDPAWAEILVQANESGDEVLLDTMIVCASCESLYSLIKKEHDFSEVGVSGSDHLTAHNIVVSALREFGVLLYDEIGKARYEFRGDYISTHGTNTEKGEFIEWCDKYGFNAKAIKEAALAMKSIYSQLDLELLAPDEFALVKANTTEHEKFMNLLAKIAPFDLVINEQHKKEGRVWTAGHSMCARYSLILGIIRRWTDKHNIRRATIEGTEISRDLIKSYAKKIPVRVCSIETDGIKVLFKRSFAGEQLEEMYELVPYSDLPENLQIEARLKFAGHLLPSTPGFETLREYNQSMRKVSEESAQMPAKRDLSVLVEKWGAKMK